MCSLDVAYIRRDFPILERSLNGRKLIYLDNAATTQKPVQVVEALKEFYLMRNANVHRGIHSLGNEASKMYEEAREKVARFINAEPEEIIFVRSATEGVNLVAYAWGLYNLDRGDKVLYTLMDHHATIVPFHIVTGFRGAEHIGVEITDDGYIDMEDLAEKIRGAKIITFPHVSNVLSTINDVSSVVKLAREAGALVLLDATQSAPHMKLDVKRLDIDFMVFSSHKMLGPTGVGVLYVRKDLYREMGVFEGGGDMIRSVSYRDDYTPVVTYADPPIKYEAGTPAFAEIAVFPVALEYLESIGMENIHRYVNSLMWILYTRLAELDGVEVYGPSRREDRAGLVSFNVEGFNAHEVAAYLDSHGVAIRSGHHCTGPLHKRLGIEASARASFYIYNTYEEAEYVASLIEELVSG